MTAPNAAFKGKLVLDDKGYESGSTNINLPTPLRRSTKIHHISQYREYIF